MRWQGGRRSTNIQDRRGAGTRQGGGLRFPIGGGGFGGGGLPGGFGGRSGGIGLVGIIAIVALYFLFGGGLGGLTGGSGTSQLGGGSTLSTQREAELEDFSARVLGFTEDIWPAILRDERRGQYVPPTMVLYTGEVDSGCGFAQSAVGPFYCPADSKVYLDLSFFDELETRFRAAGDFAGAYVIAHEVGHHVQNLLGIAADVDRQQASASQVQANGLSVRMELQADCFAGIWANRLNRTQVEGGTVIEAGDIDEALNAASAIGDDRLQREAQGRVVPDSFTHGTSEQRARWFRTGFERGTIAACDTFGVPQP